MAKEQWEEILEELVGAVLKASLASNPEYDFDLSMIKLKNFIQKEKIISKVKENQQWIAYFKSPDINKPEIAKHFEGMNMKYCSILERF